jgi:hypothetical protein
VNVGRDYSEFDSGGRRGHTFPRGRLGGAAVINRKRAEGRGKSAAEGHDSDLIKLAGRRAYQSKSQRQSVRRSIHRPTDLASRVVKRFTEVVPACGSLLYGCRCGSCHGREKQCHDQQEYFFIRGPSFRETRTCNPFAVKDDITLYEPFLLIFFFPYATIMPDGD